MTSFRCLTQISLFLFAAAATSLGCASGGDDDSVTTRRDGGGTDTFGVDASGCDPECTPPEVCIEGRCSTLDADADRDGIPADEDCDDLDDSVGRNASRPCASACGEGVTTCIAGRWMPCDAPTTCGCTDADPPRPVACERCGTQMEVCRDGEWVREGACSGMGECEAGATRSGAPCGRCGTTTETCNATCEWVSGECVGGTGACTPGEIDTPRSISCGACGEGSQMQTRSCSAACTWGEWGNVGGCGGTSSECTPGAIDRDSEACGCGTRVRARECNPATCRWGAWSAFGTCSGGGSCTPGETRTCPGSSGCTVQTCNSSCNWGACGLRSGATCEYNADDGRPGSRFRCCGGGRWQFCLSTCNWSSGCESCSGCGC